MPDGGEGYGGSGSDSYGGSGYGGMYLQVYLFWHGELISSLGGYGGTDGDKYEDGEDYDDCLPDDGEGYGGEAPSGGYEGGEVSMSWIHQFVLMKSSLSLLSGERRDIWTSV